MYYVYVIYNRIFNKIYIGQTQDLDLRMSNHNNKIFKNSYTSRFDGIWELVYKEVCTGREKALKREKQLKSFRGREFVRSKISPP
ncbi:MAG: GIY-YIG nuclease family protein [bacterium]|nr:GIY-YIG nuclease family protein [bacterium]